MVKKKAGAVTQNAHSKGGVNDWEADRVRGQHAQRTSYRGSDDYVVERVGSPDTTPFEGGADLSGFDRLVIEHAPQDFTVETVGTADPFEAAPAENFTRPFTTAFPDTQPPRGVQPQGYSTFDSVSVVGSNAADGRRSVAADRTAVQPRVAAGAGGARPVRGSAARNAQEPVASSAYGAYGQAQDPYGGRRDAHGAGGSKRRGPVQGGGRKRHRKLKVVLGIIVAALAVIACALFWYMHTLDATLDEAEVDEAADALASAAYADPFYVLVMGSDSRSVEDAEDADAVAGSLTDVMMLMRVDPKGRVITMVSIPRDTPYEWDDGTVTKMNECFAKGGTSAAVKAVSDVTGVPIAHYALVNFAQLEEIVDTLGGITVDVDIPMSYKDALTGEKISLEPGEHTLNGQEAQIFARVRKDYDDNQDAHRQSNVRTLAQAIIDKVLDRPVFEIPGTVLDLAHYVSTDMRSNDLMALAAGFGGSTKGITVYNGTGPTEGGIMDEYGGYWYCYPDPEGWARLMAVVDAGEDPSTVEYGSAESVEGWY